MTLYEINQAYAEAFENCIDEETGEILNEELLTQLEGERSDKIEAIALYIKNLSADAEALKAEKLVLANRQASTERRIESLKKYLARNLEDGEKLKTARCSLSWRKSETVEVADGYAEYLPDEFIKVEKSVRKTELKNALKNGATFEGVVLKTNNNLQIK